MQAFCIIISKNKKKKKQRTQNITHKLSFWKNFKNDPKNITVGLCIKYSIYIKQVG